MLWQKKFEVLALYDIPSNPDEEMVMSLYNPPDTSVKKTEAKDCLELLPSAFAMPFIKVKINGVDVELMVDTGAMITTVTKSTAIKCGLLAGGTVDGGNALDEQISVSSMMKTLI